MADIEQVPYRRGPVVATAGVGAAGLVAGLAAGGMGPAVFGAGVFFAAALAALYQTREALFTSRNALLAFVAVVWLIPIKLYTLPASLPFNLEIYRVFIAALLIMLAIAVILGRARFTAAGHGRPLILLGMAAVGSQLLNAEVVNTYSSQAALKSLSYFLSFLIAFLIICSVVQSLEVIDDIVRVIVLCGVAIAVLALVEGQTRYNLFDHLDRWIPLLRRSGEGALELRGGRLRVHASAQHPIALGCALTMTLPLCLYVASRATTAVRRRLWGLSAILLCAGAFATVSRTVMVMFLGLAVTAVILRFPVIRRYWPAVIAVGVLLNVAAPGAMGALGKSILGSESSPAGFEGRAGLTGSGRIADLDPGIALWKESPILGHGLGSLDVVGTPFVFQAVPSSSNAPSLIFDDQYLNSLVSLGLVGLVAVIWLVWGAVAKLGIAAWRLRTPTGDLLAACTASCAAFGVSLFVFDAFAFVQASLLFFMISAIGLRALMIVREQTETSERAVEDTGAPITTQPS
jgi:hypothetical protein